MMKSSVRKSSKKRSENMVEKKEEYPKLILSTDGTYLIAIAKGVNIRFYDLESMRDYLDEINFKNSVNIQVTGFPNVNS